MIVIKFICFKNRVSCKLFSRNSLTLSSSSESQTPSVNVNLRQVDTESIQTRFVQISEQQDWTMFETYFQNFVEFVLATLRGWTELYSKKQRHSVFLSTRWSPIVHRVDSSRGHESRLTPLIKLFLWLFKFFYFHVFVFYSPFFFKFMTCFRV